MRRGKCSSLSPTMSPPKPPLVANDCRRVAKACESMGQRVQKSVFECHVNEMQYEQLERTLLAEIDETQDNLRFYRITEPMEVRSNNMAASDLWILKAHSLPEARTSIEDQTPKLSRSPANWPGAD